MAEKRIQPKAAGTESSKGKAAAAGVQKKSTKTMQEDDEEDARQVSLIASGVSSTQRARFAGPVRVRSR